jgi:outer membrane scaffolding protein for murein synthesis (MipA/OmpV family)
LGWIAYPAVVVLLLASAGPAHAQYEVAEIPFFHTPEGTAALGGGIRLGNDLYLAFDDSSDQRQFDLVPLYLYNGRWLFFRGTAGGVHLLHTDNFELNVMGRYRFQKLDPDRNEFYEGLEKREQTVDGGVEVRWRGRFGAINANYLTDTLNRHKGQSAEVSYRYTFDLGRFSLSPFVTWAWNDDKLTNYYFGVSEAEERLPDRPAYTPGESQWIGLGMNSTWWVSGRGYVVGVLCRRHLYLRQCPQAREFHLVGACGRVVVARQLRLPGGRQHRQRDRPRRFQQE